MRSLGLLGLLLCIAPSGASQDITSDCFREDLRGPVQYVEISRVRLEARDSTVVEGEPKVIRRERYTERCEAGGKEYVGSLLYTYWDDPDGRGRRFESKRAPGSTNPTFSFPSGRPAVPEAERERGTLRETTYDPETRVLRSTLSQSGRISQDFVYQLDTDLRIVHEVMTDGDGQRSLERVSQFDASGTERIEDYVFFATTHRSNPIAGRTRYRYSAYDHHGNWTRRAVAKWEDGDWVPERIIVRTITYREPEASDE